MAVRMKAVLQYRATAGLRRQIAALDVPTVIVDETDKNAFRREMRDADILLHVLEPVTAEVIDTAPRLRLIQKIGVGVNTIDLDAARRRGIAVCNMPGTNTQAVAELTLLLMLATLRRLTQLDRVTRSGYGWKLDPELSDDLGELSGRTVGLVGFGAVARRLVPMLQAIGARVLYTSRRPAADSPIPFVSLQELLPVVDVLSLHLPLTPGDDGDDRCRGLRRDEAPQCAHQYCARSAHRRGGAARNTGERASARCRARRLFPRAPHTARPAIGAAERHRDPALGVAYGRDAGAQPHSDRRELPPARCWRAAAASRRLNQCSSLNRCPIALFLPRHSLKNCSE